MTCLSQSLKINSFFYLWIFTTLLTNEKKNWNKISCGIMCVSACIQIHAKIIFWCTKFATSYKFFSLAFRKLWFYFETTINFSTGNVCILFTSSFLLDLYNYSNYYGYELFYKLKLHVGWRIALNQFILVESTS